MNRLGQIWNLPKGWRSLLAKVNAPVRIRFRLANLLILFAVISVWLATIARKANEQRIAVEYLQRYGDVVTFDSDPDVPRWLAKMLDRDYCWTVKKVGFGHPHWRDPRLKQAKELEAFMKHLVSLSEIETLKLHSNRQFTDRSLKHLVSLDSLTRLYLNDTGICGTGLIHISTLPNLELVQLNRSDLRDVGLKVPRSRATTVTRAPQQNESHRYRHV